MHFKIIILVVALCHFSNAKVFTKCSLAQEMARLGVPRSELPDWICLAQHESSFNTKAMNTNSNKTKDWGIFQINDRWWCDHKEGRKTANSCKISCTELLTDDISKAVRCAQQIKKEHKGFTAWVAWNKHCQGSKPSVNECF